MSDGNAGYALDPIIVSGELHRWPDRSPRLPFRQVQPLYADALTAFASGDGYSGLADLGAIGAQSSYATDAIILGLFDSLPGFAGGL